MRRLFSTIRLVSSIELIHIVIRHIESKRCDLNRCYFGGPSESSESSHTFENLKNESKLETSSGLHQFSIKNINKNRPRVNRFDNVSRPDVSITLAECRSSESFSEATQTSNTMPKQNIDIKLSKGDVYPHKFFYLVLLRLFYAKEIGSKQKELNKQSTDRFRKSYFLVFSFFKVGISLWNSLLRISSFKKASNTAFSCLSELNERVLPSNILAIPTTCEAVSSSGVLENALEISRQIETMFDSNLCLKKTKFFSYLELKGRKKLLFSEHKVVVYSCILQACIHCELGEYNNAFEIVKKVKNSFGKKFANDPSLLLMAKCIGYILALERTSDFIFELKELKFIIARIKAQQLREKFFGRVLWTSDYIINRDSSIISFVISILLSLTDKKGDNLSFFCRTYLLSSLKHLSASLTKTAIPKHLNRIKNSFDFLSLFICSRALLNCARTPRSPFLLMSLKLLLYSYSAEKCLFEASLVSHLGPKQILATFYLFCYGTRECVCASYELARFFHYKANDRATALGYYLQAIKLFERDISIVKSRSCASCNDSKVGLHESNEQNLLKDMLRAYGHCLYDAARCFDRHTRSNTMLMHLAEMKAVKIPFVLPKPYVVSNDCPHLSNHKDSLYTASRLYRKAIEILDNVKQDKSFAAHVRLSYGRCLLNIDKNSFGGRALEEYFNVLCSLKGVTSKPLVLSSEKGDDSSSLDFLKSVAKVDLNSNVFLNLEPLISFSDVHNGIISLLDTPLQSKKSANHLQSVVVFPCNSRKRISLGEVHAHIAHCLHNAFLDSSATSTDALYKLAERHYSLALKYGFEAIFSHSADAKNTRSRVLRNFHSNKKQKNSSFHQRYWWPVVIPQSFSSRGLTSYCSHRYAFERRRMLCTLYLLSPFNDFSNAGISSIAEAHIKRICKLLKVSVKDAKRSVLASKKRMTQCVSMEIAVLCWTLDSYAALVLSFSSEKNFFNANESQIQQTNSGVKINRFLIALSDALEMRSSCTSTLHDLARAAGNPAIQRDVLARISQHSLLKSSSQSSNNSNASNTLFFCDSSQLVNVNNSFWGRSPRMLYALAYHLGATYISVGLNRSAVRAFEAALSIDSGNPQLLMSYAVTLSSASGGIENASEKTQRKIISAAEQSVALLEMGLRQVNSVNNIITQNGDQMIHQGTMTGLTDKANVASPESWESLQVVDPRTLRPRLVEPLQWDAEFIYLSAANLATSNGDLDAAESYYRRAVDYCWFTGNQDFSAQSNEFIMKTARAFALYALFVYNELGNADNSSRLFEIASKILFNINQKNTPEFVVEPYNLLAEDEANSAAGTGRESQLPLDIVSAMIPYVQLLLSQGQYRKTASILFRLRIQCPEARPLMKPLIAKLVATVLPIRITDAIDLYIEALMDGIEFDDGEYSKDSLENRHISQGETSDNSTKEDASSKNVFSETNDLLFNRIKRTFSVTTNVDLALEFLNILHTKTFRFEDALAGYNCLIVRFRDNVTVRVSYAQFLAKRFYAFEAAMEQYCYCLGLAPDNVNLLLSAADMMLSWSNFLKKVSATRQYRYQHFPHSEKLFSMADGLEIDAERLFCEAFERNQQAAAGEYADFLTSRGHINKAIAICQKALAGCEGSFCAVRTEEPMCNSVDKSGSADKKTIISVSNKTIIENDKNIMAKANTKKEDEFNLDSVAEDAKCKQTFLAVSSKKHEDNVTKNSKLAYGSERVTILNHFASIVERYADIVGTRDARYSELRSKAKTFYKLALINSNSPREEAFNSWLLNKEKCVQDYTSFSHADINSNDKTFSSDLESSSDRYVLLKSRNLLAHYGYALLCASEGQHDLGWLHMRRALQLGCTEGNILTGAFVFLRNWYVEVQQRYLGANGDDADTNGDNCDGPPSVSVAPALAQCESTAAASMADCNSAFESLQNMSSSTLSKLEDLLNSTCSIGHNSRIGRHTALSGPPIEDTLFRISLAAKVVMHQSLLLEPHNIQNYISLMEFYRNFPVGTASANSAVISSLEEVRMKRRRVKQKCVLNSPICRKALAEVKKRWAEAEKYGVDGLCEEEEFEMLVNDQAEQ